MTKHRNYYKSNREEMLEFVPNTAKAILDIGCSEGNFGRLLKQRNNAIIYGVEIDNASYKKAKNKLDKVYLGGVEENLKKIPKKYFDCIVFNDVLEHLKNPDAVVQSIKTKLKKGGSIVVSLPNIRNFKILKQIIFEKDFKYTTDGILDKTHLRFFTYKSMRYFFENNGLIVIKEKGIGKSKNFIFNLVNFLTFGFFTDSLYNQFAFSLKYKISGKVK
ncbi:MAG: class I SAM-dependent methyltransferase [bacterium]